MVLFVLMLVLYTKVCLILRALCICAGMLVLRLVLMLVVLTRCPSVLWEAMLMLADGPSTMLFMLVPMLVVLLLLPLLLAVTARALLAALLLLLLLGAVSECGRECGDEQGCCCSHTQHTALNTPELPVAVLVSFEHLCDPL
jgi:hypothetical protein